jgi:hypothetical protein
LGRSPPLRNDQDAQGLTRARSALVHGFD